MTRLLAPLSIISLAACAAGGAGYETGQLAESEARQVVARDFPGVDIDGLANCVRDNASEEQLAALSVGGVLATDATSTVLEKPETEACIRDNNIELPA